MLRLAFPVDGIDGVRPLIAVVHTFLIAHHFLACIDERHALRSEHRRLRQLIQPGKLFGSDTGDAGLQSVHQAHIIVTRYIANHLHGLFRPGSLTVIHFSIIDLRMPYSTDNTEFDTLLSPRQSGKESALTVIVERTAQRITHFVGESCDARHLIGIGFHRQGVLRQLGSRCSPSLSINKDGRVYRCCRLAYFVHGFDVVNAH